MREDSGTNRDTGGRARRTDGAVRTGRTGVPFWVIRDTGMRGPEQARGAQGRDSATHAARHEGRTGVDLRAAEGAGRREPLSGPRPKLRERARTVPLLPWRRNRRGTQAVAAKSTTMPAATHATTHVTTHATIGTVTESLAARGPRRKRSRRRIHINVGLALLALAQVAVLGLIAWGLTSPTWQVRYVQVQMQGMQDTALVEAIQKLPLTGCNIFRCDTARQTRLVAGLPAVASAQVHPAYPDGLIVVVSPRRPALLWQVNGQTSDQALVVASDGTVLGTQASDPAYAKAALPVIYDDAGAAFGGETPKAGAQIPAVTVEMAGQLRKGMAAALGSPGWTLDFTANTGFVAMGPHGEQVIFGLPADAASAFAPSVAPAALGSTPDTATVDAGVRAQLDEVRSLEALLASKGQRASLIDVRWGAHPYYRMDG